METIVTKTPAAVIDLPHLLEAKSNAKAGIRVTRHLQRSLPLRTAQRNAAIKAWVAEYRAAFAREPAQHRKRNAGVRAANSWLLAQVRESVGGAR